MEYLTSHSEIAQAYEQYLHRIDVFNKGQDEINAEASLLMMDSARKMRVNFYLAHRNSNFARRYACLIVRSPHPIQTIEAADMFGALGDPGEAFILTDPHRRLDDSIWTDPEEEPNRTFVWPHPITPGRHQFVRGPNRFREMEPAVQMWRNVAVKIPDEQVELFCRGMMEKAFNVRVVVSDVDSVIAVLRLNSRTRGEWADACRDLQRTMRNIGLADIAVRPERIVPLPQYTRGRGTIVYLA